MARQRKTEHDLCLMLAKRYSAPAWAFFRGVRNSTGHTRTPRTADALAIGLYPSRGLSVHGFEVKSQRADWHRELAKPTKSEAVQQYCDYWWVVAADKTIVDVAAGELPKTWGLLVPRKGGVLVTVVDAPQLEPKPLDRRFIAAICRRAHEDSRPDQETLHAMREEIREEISEKRQGRCGHEYELDSLKSQLARAQADLKTYRDAEREAGFAISEWNLKGRVQTVQLMANGGIKHLRDKVEHVQRLADEVGIMTTETLMELKDD